MWLTVHSKSWCVIISLIRWAPPTASSISSRCRATDCLLLWWWQANKLGAITMETFHRDIRFWSWWRITFLKKPSRACNQGTFSSNHGNRYLLFNVGCKRRKVTLSWGYLRYCKGVSFTLSVSLWASGSSKDSSCRAWTWWTTDWMPAEKRTSQFQG